MCARLKCLKYSHIPGGRLGPSMVHQIQITICIMVLMANNSQFSYLATPPAQRASGEVQQVLTGYFHTVYRVNLFGVFVDTWRFTFHSGTQSCSDHFRASGTRRARPTVTYQLFIIQGTYPGLEKRASWMPYDTQGVNPEPHEFRIIY